MNCSSVFRLWLRLGLQCPDTPGRAEICLLCMCMFVYVCVYDALVSWGLVFVFCMCYVIDS